MRFVLQERPLVSWLLFEAPVEERLCVFEF